MSFQNQVLGTIISSVLNYDQLCSEINERPSSNSASSTFAPCDGRPIVGSKLETSTKVGPNQPIPENHFTHAPDLRGKFQRGLNVFYSPGEPILNINEADSDGANRRVCNYQADELRSHRHYISGSVLNCGTPPGYQVINNTPTPNYEQPSRDTGGSETRPKNVAVYFYIKIN